MTVRDLYERLCDRIPPALSCAWDRDGLMVCPDASRPVERILCTLDVTEEAVNYAIENRFDLIVSHHPLLFHPLGAVTEEDHVARKVMRLLQGDVSVMCFHTRADAVAGGVNDRLCEMLGLEDVAPLGEGEAELARIGILPQPMLLSDFAASVKEILGAPMVLVADAGRTVQCVTLCGGDGKDFVSAAREAGADTYLSGRIGYHLMADGPETGLNMLEAGHYYTETHITGFFAELCEALLPEATVEEFSSDVILFQ